MGVSWAIQTLLAVSSLGCGLQAFYLPILSPAARISPDSIFCLSFRRATTSRWTELEAQMTIPVPAQDDKLSRIPAPSVRRCSGYEGWTPDAAKESSGLLIPRHLSAAHFPDLQQRVEDVARRMHVGDDTLVGARIPIVLDDGRYSPSRSLAQRLFPWPGTSESEGNLAKIQTEVMHDIRKALMEEFSPSFVDFVMHDISGICAALTRMVAGKSNGLELKLELIGENACKKWHHDYFTGRAIVTYCGMSGTTFCDSPSMSLDEVRNIAACDEQVPFCESAQVGDIMFIKGAKYNEKGGEGGEALVHRSPDVSYRPDKSVVTRLCLKVDADSFIEPEFGLLSRACTAEH